MKRILISLLTLGCFAAGADKVTLDTKLINADGEACSLYSIPDSVLVTLNRAEAYSTRARESKITFFVDVDELYGARKLERGKKYRLDSFSWHGHPSGYFTGGSRKVIISNGFDDMERRMPESTSGKVTVRQRKSEHPFTFTEGDILEITLQWEGDRDDMVAVRFYDAPPQPAKIEGTSFNLLDEDKLNDGDASRNVYIKAWRYNCPAIRIRATKVEEYDIEQIAMIGGGILVGLVLLKLIFSRKKKAKK